MREVIAMFYLADFPVRSISQERMMKKLLAALSAALFAFGLSACNTVQGFGKDLERGGEKVQETSQDARR
jgi:predicted small secreted protein